MGLQAIPVLFPLITPESLQNLLKLTRKEGQEIDFQTEDKIPSFIY